MRLLLRNPLQQFPRRLIRRVLLHQLPAHGEVQHKAAQAADGVWCVGHAIIEGEEAVWIHRTSATVRIPFNSSRTDMTSASAAVSSLRSVSGSP